MDREDAACSIAGCVSRYRLHIHHITRWIDGGRTDPENLTTVCWFHHHIVIHSQGFTINPNSPPQRRRLIPPHRFTAHPGSNTPDNAAWSSPNNPNTETQNSKPQTRDTRLKRGQIFVTTAP